jgi:prophage maintenance system killer protein
MRNQKYQQNTKYCRIYCPIAGSHMFANGNKRTAVAAFKSFATQIGFKTVSHNRMMDIATKVATNKITDVSEIAKKLVK